MIKDLVLLGVGLPLLLACGDPLPPGLHRVTTEPTAFTPDRIEIAARDSVEWRFGGTHNVVFRADSGAGRPADIPASPEGRYVREFKVTGVFHYACTLHPGMTGAVVVR